MSRHFESLESFALHLLEREVATAVAIHEGLERVLARIEKTARDEFGNYQPSTGPFPEWAELADATKEDRLRQGYTENDPLLRSGELMESSSHEVHGLEGVAGSTDPRMVYLEFGTSKMPPRPVWGPALVKNHKAIQMMLGAAVVEGLVGGDLIHEALGYNFETEE